VVAGLTEVVSLVGRKARKRQTAVLVASVVRAVLPIAERMMTAVRRVTAGPGSLYVAARAIATASWTVPAPRSAADVTTAPSASGSCALRLRRGNLARVLVMGVTVAMLGTVALPAYAALPTANSSQEFGIAHLLRTGAQTLEVASDVITAVVAQDGYSVVSGADVRAEQERVVAEQQRAVAEQQRAVAEQQRAVVARSGPSLGATLANPPYPAFSLDHVFSVAKSYIGVPYAYGGDSPAGFDCSGFVMYVYAQFGITLPHSSAEQGAAGRAISLADARPGDLVIMAGHDGIYAGEGMILHAPYAGSSVRIQPIWTEYRIVRLGI